MKVQKETRECRWTVSCVGSELHGVDPRPALSCVGSELHGVDPGLALSYVGSELRGVDPGPALSHKAVKSVGDVASFMPILPWRKRTFRTNKHRSPKLY